MSAISMHCQAGRRLFFRRLPRAVARLVPGSWGMLLPARAVGCFPLPPPRPRGRCVNSNSNGAMPAWEPHGQVNQRASDAQPHAHPTTTPIHNKQTPQTPTARTCTTNPPPIPGASRRHMSSHHTQQPCPSTTPTGHAHQPHPDTPLLSNHTRKPHHKPAAGEKRRMCVVPARPCWGLAPEPRCGRGPCWGPFLLQGAHQRPMAPSHGSAACAWLVACLWPSQWHVVCDMDCDVGMGVAFKSTVNIAPNQLNTSS